MTATDAETRAMLSSSSNLHGHYHHPVAKHYGDSSGYHSNRVVSDYALSRSATEGRNVVTSPKIMSTKRGNVTNNVSPITSRDRQQPMVREKKDKEDELEADTWLFDTSPPVSPGNQVREISEYVHDEITEIEI